MNRAFVALLALAALLGVSNAQQILGAPCIESGVIAVTSGWYCSYVYPNLVASWTAWAPLAVIVVIFSFFVGTIIFVFGVALRNDRVRTFGVGEIYEAIASMIIVGLFLFVTSVVFGLLPGIFVATNPYQTALVTINNTIGATGNLAGQLFAAQMIPSYYASILINVCGPSDEGVYDCEDIPQIYAAPLMILFALPATAICVLLIDGLLVLNAEFYAIIFFMVAAIPVFLIPGILLRAFLPTRSMGGMMVAIAIGFYMIMPTLFAISYQLTSVGVSSQLTTLAGQINAQSQGSGSETNALTPTSPLVEDVGTAGSALGPFWISILFYPGLILAMTYGFIITIAEFIGGMASSSGRMRALV